MNIISQHHLAQRYMCILFYTDFAGEVGKIMLAVRIFLASFSKGWILLTRDKMELVSHRLHISTYLSSALSFCTEE